MHPTMDPPITEEESYAERRQLFRNIWETALNIDKKDKERKARNVINTPKVIKTARLDEVNRRKAEKKKEQRLRNLTIVCNKLLHFCNRQDADGNMFHEQMAAKDWETLMRKKGRTLNKSRISKIRKARKALARQDSSQTEITSPDSSFNLDKSSRKSSPTKETSLSAPENYCNRKKRRRVSQLTEAKVFIRARDKYPNKRLFPINKIYIN